MAKIKPKNVIIGHADTFFVCPSAAGAGSAVPPLAAAENISLKRSVDGSTFLNPNKYNNLQEKDIHKNQGVFQGLHGRISKRFVSLYKVTFCKAM